MDLLAERKSLTDLIGSIHDKRCVKIHLLNHMCGEKPCVLTSHVCRNPRYKRQKMMIQKCGLRYPCYVVEGEWTHSGLSDQEMKTVRTATAETLMDGFTVRRMGCCVEPQDTHSVLLQVLRTKDVSGTVQLYGHMTTFLESRYANLTAVPGAEALPSIDAFQAATREGNTQRDRSVADVWATMLSTVKGACLCLRWWLVNHRHICHRH